MRPSVTLLTPGPRSSRARSDLAALVPALGLAEETGCEEAVFVRDGLLLEATVSNLVGEVADD